MRAFKKSEASQGKYGLGIEQVTNNGDRRYFRHQERRARLGIVAKSELKILIQSGLTEKSGFVARRQVVPPLSSWTGQYHHNQAAACRASQTVEASAVALGPATSRRTQRVLRASAAPTTETGQPATAGLRQAIAVAGWAMVERHGDLDVVMENIVHGSKKTWPPTARKGTGSMIGCSFEVIHDHGDGLWNPC